jgi:hypothetical protein
MFDFGHISTIPGTSTSFSDMGKTICACPDTAHMATSAVRRRATHFMSYATRREHVEDCVENLADVHLAPTAAALG